MQRRFPSRTRASMSCSPRVATCSRRTRPKVAAELARVTRPGGRVVFLAWTLEGGLGGWFRITNKHVPPPAGSGESVQLGRSRKGAPAPRKRVPRPRFHPRGLPAVRRFTRGDLGVVLDTLRANRPRRCKPAGWRPGGISAANCSRTSRATAPRTERCVGAVSISSRGLFAREWARQPHFSGMEN